MKITLKDGSVKEYEHSMSVIDIAKDLSEGLARVCNIRKSQWRTGRFAYSCRF
mgnify:CR=1 FL=1